MNHKRVTILLVIILLVAMSWKLFLVIADKVPFNADEAVVGLMARHILQGNWSIFFYGQSYMGSLDATLVAVGFAIFGQSVWVIRLVQSLLFAGVLATTYWLGLEAFQSPKVGLVAAGLLAIPTVNVTLYTTASLGGYGEALLVGNLLLVLALKLGGRAQPVLAFLWGVFAGLGLWANGLTLVYSFPALVFLIYKVGRSIGPLKLLPYLLYIGLGGALGAMPWWIYAAQNGFTNLLMELLGSAVAVEQLGWLERTGMHLVNFILLGIPVTLGLRPPWSVDWLALPLIPFALAAWVVVFISTYRAMKRERQKRDRFGLIGGVGLTLVAGFLFTAFGIDPSGRYFLPLGIPLAIFAALYGVHGPDKLWLRTSVLLTIVLYQVAGNVQSVANDPPGLTTQFHQPTIIDRTYDQELIQFLFEQQETKGYSNYWVAYPLAFHSEEKLIFTPMLPYHTDLRYTQRDNRYAPYQKMVDDSQRAAYITTRNAALDEKLEAGFAKLKVTYSQKQIGDYHIYYGFSRKVEPQEIGFGTTWP